LPASPGGPESEQTAATAELSPAEAEGLAEDRAFAPYFDAALLAEAIQALDAATLVDLSLRLADGERALLRKRAGVSAGRLMRLAARIAAETRDKDSFQRLKKAAQAGTDHELQQHLAALEPVLSQSRAANGPAAAFGVANPSPADDAIKALLHDADLARITGDASELKKWQSNLAGVQLNSAQQSQLRDVLTRAVQAATQAEGADAELLRKLSGESRASTAVLAIEGAVSRLAKVYVVRELGAYPWEGSTNWGNQIEKRVWNPIKFKHETIRANHGQWSKYSVALDNAGDNLYIEVRNSRSSARDTLTFQVYLRTRIRAGVTIQEWSWGAKLGSATFNARADLKLWVDIAVKITPKSLTQFTISVNSTNASITYENLVFDRVGLFGGYTAETLGRLVESVFRGWFSAKYAAVRNKACESIRRACAYERDIYLPIKKLLGI
jgi:hypothetical protein